MATFSIMIELPDPPVPGRPLYGYAEIARGAGITSERATGMTDRDSALAVARNVATTSGRHVRVYVDGCNYDTADFGPRPSGYSPRSAVSCRLQRGIPCAPRRTKEGKRHV